MLTSDEEKTTLFIKRALKQLPALTNLNLTSDEWLELVDCYEKRGLKRLSTRFIVGNLSAMRKIDIDLLLKPHTKPLPRAAKSPVTPPSAPRKRKRFHFYDKENEGPNPLILAAEPENAHLHSPLRKKNVRICDLSPASPEPRYENHEKLMRTPGGTKVHEIYSKKDYPRCSLFKPLTPVGSKTTGGMVDTSKAGAEKIKSRLPRALFGRTGVTRFTATLEKLQERQGARRGIGQKQLTGATCRDVFTAHDSETVIDRGYDCHWCHKIAHFYGGEQSRENLIPGTAASNYNTLELVEQFVARQLTSGIKAIEILVTPKYSNDSLIPDELVFQLTWQDPHDPDDVPRSEKITINPRSWQRITGAMHSSIEFIRESGRQHEGESSSKTSAP